MAGGEAVGAELARKANQIDELHTLVAARARHRRAALGIFIDEAIDHAAAEAIFEIQDVVGDSEPVGDLPGVIDVLSGAARPRTSHRLAMVVELERNADHFGASPRGEGGRHRTVDAAGHGNDDSGIARGAAKLKIDLHWKGSCQSLYPNFTPGD